MHRITLRLPEAMLTALTERATAEHRDLSGMIRRILSLELTVSASETLDPAANPELPLVP
jgi:predicted DNA binding CopG/RHH family protein